MVGTSFTVASCIGFHGVFMVFYLTLTIDDSDTNGEVTHWMSLVESE